MVRLRNPIDHGYSMFNGAFGKIATLTKNGVNLAQPKPVHPAQESPGMDDATPINTLSQYG